MIRQVITVILFFYLLVMVYACTGMMERDASGELVINQERIDELMQKTCNFIIFFTQRVYGPSEKENTQEAIGI